MVSSFQEVGRRTNYGAIRACCNLQNNYLVAIAPARTQTGLAAVDVSTGEFLVTWFAPNELPAALDAELQRLAPSECLVVEGSRSNAYQIPSATMTVTPCPPYFFDYEASSTRL